MSTSLDEEDAAHHLWVAFHKHSTDVLRVSRTALATYIGDEAVPDNLIATPPRAGSTTVEVTRAELWKLLTGSTLKKEWFNV